MSPLPPAPFPAPKLGRAPHSGGTSLPSALKPPHPSAQSVIWPSTGRYPWLGEHPQRGCLLVNAWIVVLRAVPRLQAGGGLLLKLLPHPIKLQGPRGEDPRPFGRHGKCGAWGGERSSLRGKSLSRFAGWHGIKGGGVCGKRQGQQATDVSGGAGRGARDTLINPAPDFVWGSRPEVNQDGHREH